MTHRPAAAVATFALILGVLSAAPTSTAAGTPATSTGSSWPVPVQHAPVAPTQGEPPLPASGIAAVDLSVVAPPDKRTASVTGALGSVADAVISGEEIPDGDLEAVVVHADRIRVEVIHDGTPAAVTAVTAAGGHDVVEITTTLLAADVPAAALAALDDTPAIASVTLPAVLSAPVESAAPPLTSGTAGADIYGKTLIASLHEIGLTGAGVSVGIVDYFDRGTWRDARAKGDVPTAAGSFCRWGGKTCNVYDSPNPDVHGVAVAEAIHDVAPAAKLYLATVQTREDLKAAIDYFAQKGVRVLSRSLGGFFDGAGDGTGPSAALVDYAVKKGITWFNAAGNSGAYTSAYSDGTKVRVGGYWRGEWRDSDGDDWMEFARQVVDQDTGLPTGEVTYTETMQIACTPFFRLRWNDWDTNRPTDYDIYRIVGDTVLAPGYPANSQANGDDLPLELQDGSSQYFRCSPGQWITVGIHLDNAGESTAGDILELQGNSGDILETAVSEYSAGSAFIDSKNPGLAAVGAVDPVDGILIAGYSSQGPTNDGRIKPEISAGSNFTSRAYTYTGGGGRFNGTSAATPVVAGAAAVVLQRFSTRSPAQLIDYLRTSHTTDRGTPGIDNVYGTGELIMSPIPVATFRSTPAPKITGTRAVGSTLTAVKPTWKPSASFTYRWFRGSTPISGATKSTYKLTAADAAKKIRVRVIGSRGGYTTVTKYSSYTAPIAKLFTKAPTPKISGVAKVGRTLTASVGTWSPKPSKFTYQWKANGKAIKGATKKSYKITSSRAGARITVTVTAVKSGYKSTAKTSAKTAKVTR